MESISHICSRCHGEAVFGFGATWLCEDCYGDEADRAHSRSMKAHYGGSTPQTDTERQDAARRQR